MFGVPQRLLSCIHTTWIFHFKELKRQHLFVLKAQQYYILSEGKYGKMCVTSKPLLIKLITTRKLSCLPSEYYKLGQL